MQSEVKRVWVSVLHEFSHGEWTSAELEGLLSSIPAEFQPTAVARLSSEYDSVEFEIGYWRPQTAEEEAEEDAQHKRFARRREEEERAQYESLKRKFG